MFKCNNVNYESIPLSITLQNGLTRTSLHELSKAQQEELGLFEYETITPEFDSLYKYWDGSYTIDETDKTATKNIVGRPAEQIKADKLRTMLAEQAAIQSQGFTCTNGIKLQVNEDDLQRWTQLMAGLLAFSPENVNIRDYNNTVHTLTLAEATQMLGEVFIWGQTFLAYTWAKKDAIMNEVYNDN